ncbi:DUF2493 domain-containing protein [Sphingomonas sp. ACRSK]|uniref:DUF2493 domain-containing protein n=1 Tax=Sphingomonas sp. ACRSK TaxID=2918213 RepID=UPI001EF45AC0|nr:DUF2493 domain-containing protein [Sphingomonas sp. ACRSK]MCG7348815.1 DUF2493 domain-containing protein [Sphingomonas sp. ACRSK]
MKRVLITGGRYFNLVDEVHRALNPIRLKHGIEELGQGGATGADELSMLWALSNGIPVSTYEPNWKLFGGRAGMMRNTQMLRAFKPTIGVAFPGGRGTRDMTAKLIEAGVPTLVGRFTDASETAVKWKLA